MADYKEYLTERHPELLIEADEYFAETKKSNKPRRKSIDRSSWEYVCKFMPKLADLAHERIAAETCNRDFGWYVYRLVTVGNRTAEIGIKLWVHANKLVGPIGNWTKQPLDKNEHIIEFYKCFDHASTSCQQMMTTKKGEYAMDGHGNKFPMDIPTKRKQIYKYLGI